IGGTGKDKLQGGDGDDLLIAGATDFDANDDALYAVMKEWTSAHDYLTRVKNLRNGGGGGTDGPQNGTVFLVASPIAATVHDDAAADQLAGGNGRDWFFARVDAAIKDMIGDLAAGEEKNLI
ncbi:MAG: hypothetical protein HY000_22830, partial [Planctomycetes bacterium]|nr:hypothetical protein [Planctomycetota bacterium]